MRQALRALAMAGTFACASASALTSHSTVTRDSGPPKERVGREVKDLHYGDVLFYFYQDDFFDSIVSLNAYRELGFTKPHSDDGELLLGGMLLSYGQHEQAADIFHRLLDTSPKQDVRNRAWYFLARIAHEHGAIDSAAEALSHIQGKLPKEMEPARLLLQSQVLIEQGRYDDAAAMLNKWVPPEDWRRYAGFNLGVAQISGGHVAEGLETLEGVGGIPTLDDEQMALRDRINLTLGFERMRANQPDRARHAFESVRLEGPYSNKALLGLGWADSALEQDRDALTPWLALNKRDLLDPAVEESLLAVPYAFGRLGTYGQAAARYEQAIVAFDTENKHLDDSIASIRSGQMLAALLADPAANSAKDQKPKYGPQTDASATPPPGQNWQLDQLPDSPESRYLTHLMASHEFQQGLRNYRDLRFLQSNLNRWSRDVATFSDMLATRKLGYEQHRPDVDKALQQTDLVAIRQQRDALAGRLATIESSQDASGLANDHELEQLNQLQSIQQRIDQLGDAPEAADLRDQARLLNGVLRWNLSHEFNLRLWQQKRALTELDDALTKAEAQRQSVAGAEPAEEARLQDFGGRIDAQTPRIAQLQAATDALMKRQQQALEDLAVAELQRYQERLRGYTLESRFALAQIYDRAASKTPAADKASVAEPAPAPVAAPAPASSP
jgi:hypothetical protein